MKKIQAVILHFPGTNCNQDTKIALEQLDRISVTEMDWRSFSNLINFDWILIPGGFSFGDYLRSGAIAASFDRIGEYLHEANLFKKPILGICNGFQILTELKILPGALMKNPTLKFMNDLLPLQIEKLDSPFLQNFINRKKPVLPIANNDGFFFCNDQTLSDLEKKEQILFRYSDPKKTHLHQKIAAICNENGNVIGMMPHPERAIHSWHGSQDGKLFLQGILDSFFK